MKKEMEREYSYAELCRMTKKRVIRIAGYANIKKALQAGLNREIDGFDVSTGRPLYRTVKLTKKYVARTIASDR